VLDILTKLLFWAKEYDEDNHSGYLNRAMEIGKGVWTVYIVVVDRGTSTILSRLTLCESPSISLPSSASPQTCFQSYSQTH